MIASPNAKPGPDDVLYMCPRCDAAFWAPSRGMVKCPNEHCGLEWKEAEELE